MGTEEMIINHWINGLPYDPHEDTANLTAELEKTGKESQEFWARLSDDTRQVYIKVCMQSIELLYNSVDYWLPHALESVEGLAGDRIRIVNEILFTDVHAQVKASEDVTAFQEAVMENRIRDRVEQKRASRTDEEFMAYVDECIANGQRLSIAETKRLRGMIDA